jgi:ADP-ribose pyrophosphatase
MESRVWECLESRKIFEAKDERTTFMELYQDRVRTPSGSIFSYTRYISSDVVIVVPFLDKERMVMIRQYRYPLDKVMLEFPAGHVENGEDPAATAYRELEEETGYRAKTMQQVYQYHPSVSKSRQIVHVFRADDLVEGKINREGTEMMDTEIVSIDRLQQLIVEGKVENAGTLISYLLCCTGMKIKTEG